ncbi:DNA/RNA helicase domain-containing protein [Novilysobacter defluvii]|uniref:DNA/RNA helicase domain-containing protein n=1 Tax=Novilysobacter defluvii TaxID=391738 RepID=UPI00042A6544|nr:DNA/RNA helicase domain-containing protein [Lysobacter defluvii]
MAVMWPRRLPTWVVSDPRRRAEREVYAAFQQTLDDAWSVYYSRPWWGLTSTGAEVDGEADFVVAHPRHGVLFLEVKGGLVSHNPSAGSWTSKDSMGITHRIKDPLGQAMKSKHELLKKFKAARGWPDARVRLRHGAILPDCQSRDSLVAGYERELFCFSSDLRDRFEDWLLARLSSHACSDREVGPGREGMEAIDRVIAAPANLTVPLHRQVSADLAEQDALLTGAQLLAISSIDEYPRVVVEGGAGTGKTVVAVELSIRYAGRGLRTLLCCLSGALVEDLRRRIGDQANLDVETLETVVRSPRDRYDAVIVDEGQDVDWNQWDELERCLLSTGLLRVFFDSNQAVYRARDDLQTRLQASGFPLRLNLRNTRRVAAVTERLYRGPLISCCGPEGRRVVHLEVPFSRGPDEVVDAVRELVRDQEMLPTEIAVLVPGLKVADAVRAMLSAAGFMTTNALQRDAGAVTVDTIAGFKGLESPAVILLVDFVSANNDELSYVGASRARSLLVIVGAVARTKLGKAVGADTGSDAGA